MKKVEGINALSGRAQFFSPGFSPTNLIHTHSNSPHLTALAQPRPNRLTLAAICLFSMQKVVGSSPIIRLETWKPEISVFDSDYGTFCMLAGGQGMCASVKTLSPSA
jgi:hypothetical protein